MTTWQATHPLPAGNIWPGWSTGAVLHTVGSRVAAAAATCRKFREARTRARVESLDVRTLRDIGLTRYGVRESALAPRNET